MITKIIHEEKIQKAKKYVEKGEKFCYCNPRYS